VKKMSNLNEEDVETCAEYADKAGLEPEETAKAYYLAAKMNRDPVLFFADLMLEKMEMSKQGESLGEKWLESDHD